MGSTNLIYGNCLDHIDATSDHPSAVSPSPCINTTSAEWGVVEGGAIAIPSLFFVTIGRPEFAVDGAGIVEPKALIFDGAVEWNGRWRKFREKARIGLKVRIYLVSGIRGENM